MVAAEIASSRDIFLPFMEDVPQGRELLYFAMSSALNRRSILVDSGDLLYALFQKSNSLQGTLATILNERTSGLNQLNRVINAVRETGQFRETTAGYSGYPSDGFVIIEEEASRIGTLAKEPLFGENHILSAILRYEGPPGTIAKEALNVLHVTESLKSANYLNSLTKEDRTNVEEVLGIVRRVRRGFENTRIAVLAVGSSSKAENEGSFAGVRDIDLRITTSTESNSEERKHTVATLRNAIREHLQKYGLSFKEMDFSVAKRPVLDAQNVLSSFLDYYNNDPSFLVVPSNGLPLHIFISGLDNFSLDVQLNAEQQAKTSAIILLNH